VSCNHFMCDDAQVSTTMATNLTITKNQVGPMLVLFSACGHEWLIGSPIVLPLMFPAIRIIMLEIPWPILMIMGCLHT
jgi:hypothetical protein